MRFTDPHLLEQIGGTLNRFLERFSKELSEAHPDLPSFKYGELDHQPFFTAARALLLKPDSLPKRLREDLRAIEELAAPKNRELLRGLSRELGIEGQPLDPPEKIAIEYYLRSPFALDHFEDLHQRLRNSLPDTPDPPVSSNGDSHPSNGSDHFPILDLPLPPRSVPGDLAAIARYPRHKISKLPPEVRESINQMLRQRVPYRDILQRLGDLGQALNKNNLYRWKRTGYLIWLQEQQKREEARAQLELLLDLARENGNDVVHEAAQQLATLKICSAIADLNLAALTHNLQQDPAALLRLVQALPRLGQGSVTCQQFRLDTGQLRAKLAKEDAPKMQDGLSPTTIKKIETELNLF